MKLLTLNFLTCPVAACKKASTATITTTTTSAPDSEDQSSSAGSPFPLHIRDAELEAVDLEYNPLFWRNVLPRLEWAALEGVCAEVGLRIPALEEVERCLAAEEGKGQGKQGEDYGADIGAGAGASGGGSEVVMEDVGTNAGSEEDVLRKLHNVLLETQIVTGSLVCGRCGHEFGIREGIANMLLPPHLV